MEDFEDPLRVRASGPYVRSKGTLPKLDLDVALETQGAGQAIELGALSTGDRLFVEFGGAYYEQDRAEVARTNRRLARDRARNGGSLADLGFDAADWVRDARREGEEEVGGVTTERISGTVDARAALTEVNRLVRQSAGSLARAGGSARPLTRRELERLADSVESSAFDVYVGKQDGIVRRLSLRLEVAVPENDREELRGMTSASVRLVVQLADVGGDQQVTGPSSARPLSDLTRQLGSLDALAGGVLGGSLGGDATTTTPAPGNEGEAQLDAFERYANCLDAADPDDAAAIAQCRALLP